jgi:hypothetical protein
MRVLEERISLFFILIVNGVTYLDVPNHVLNLLFGDGKTLVMCLAIDCIIWRLAITILIVIFRMTIQAQAGARCIL